MKKYLKSLTAIIITVMTTAVISCGGSSDSINALTGTEVYGTAAVGAAIIGTVNIKGANGVVSRSAVRADGSYTVDVSALTTPFIIFVEGSVGSRTVRLYSTVDLPGRANVTPATHLAMALALKGDPETLYPPAEVKNDNVKLEAPGREAIEAAKIKVQNILKNVFSTLNVPENFDIMNGEFTVGNGFDKLLEIVKMDVETTDSGTVVVAVSDAVSGDKFYTAGADGSNEVNNTANMADVINTSKTDVEKIRSLYNRYIPVFSMTDGTKIGALLGEIYAEDYLKDGMGKSDAIKNEILNGMKIGEIKSAVVTGVTISGPVEDVKFNGGAYTVTDANAPKYENITIPAGTEITFEAGTASALKGSNYRAVKFIYTATVVFANGESAVFTESDYCVQKEKDGDWKLWGNRALVDCGFNTGNIKTIREVNDHGTWKLETSKFSGYDIDVDDDANLAYDFGKNKFGNKPVNVLLVTGEGMKAEYTDDHRKGVLLFNPDDADIEFSPINVAQNEDLWERRHVCMAERDLDVSKIRSTELTVIALHYDGKNTLTPLYTWKCDAGSIPMTAAQLTDDLFASFNLSSAYIKDYDCFNAFPWNFNISWTPPLKSGLTLGSLSCWFSDGKGEGQNEDLINWNEADSKTTSYSFSMKDEETEVTTNLQFFHIWVDYTNKIDGVERYFKTKYLIADR